MKTSIEEKVRKNIKFNVILYFAAFIALVVYGMYAMDDEQPDGRNSRLMDQQPGQ